MSKYKEYTDGIDAYEYCLLELGCPFEVVFKALANGITFEHKGVNLISNDIHLFYFNHRWILRVYAFIQGYGSDIFDFELKDYQKTWWLKGEKDE